MSRVAVLGLGAMGQRMALRLVNAGHDVTVWRRSGAPEAPMGWGRFADTPRAAAAEADLVIVMVTDDEASRAVWLTPETGALWGLRKQAIAIESSTLTPAWVSSLGQRVESVGAAFLDAPVVGSRPQAEAGGLVHLVGGTPEAVERARPVLGALGNALHHLGATPAGATAKLLVNALFGVQVALLGELLGFARQSGLGEDRMLEVLGSLPVTSPAAKVAGAAMASGRFDPMFPLTLVEKDFHYMVQAATALGASLPVTRRGLEVLTHACARGLGGENITALAKLYR